VITVRLVKPVAPHQIQPLPNDFEGGEPDGWAFFLMGQDEAGSPKRDPHAPPRGPSGPGGFAP